MLEPLPLPDWIASLPAEWTAGCDDRCFVVARGAYDSPGRVYHTWAHAAACIELLRTFPCDNPGAVFLALVFHDAIYLPGRKDNEERSAALANETLRANAAVSESDLASIERMILATRDHHALGASLSASEQTMLDLDLSILGAQREDYAGYARAIRDEYCPAVANEFQYRVGRRGFLAGIIAAPNIFLTPEGRRRWDAAARENLRWEDAELAAEQSIIERLATKLRVP